MQILRPAYWTLRIGQLPEAVLSPSDGNDSFLFDQLEDALAGIAGLDGVESGVARKQERQGIQVQLLHLGRPLIVDPMAKSTTPSCRSWNSVVCTPAHNAASSMWPRTRNHPAGETSVARAFAGRDQSIAAKVTGCVDKHAWTGALEKNRAPVASSEWWVA